MHSAMRRGTKLLEHKISNVILIALVFTVRNVVFGNIRVTTVPVDVKSLLLLVLAVTAGFQLYLNLLPSL